MTEWRPLGILPPIGEEEWTEEFNRYKKFPEYGSVHSNMDLEGFKRIFFFEYSHRMLGRGIGLAFTLPLAYFLAKGRIPTHLRARLTGIVFMIGGQGALGWYMVKSGLEVKDGEVPRVSHLRLASHLVSAFAIYAGILWTWMDVRWPDKTPAPAQTLAHPSLRRVRVLAPLTAGVVLTTVLSGAFVAGLDAGTVYNEWPLMGGKIFPEDGLELDPKWRNFIYNPSTVQFDHRTLGYTSAASTAVLFMTARGIPGLPRGPRAALHAVAGMAFVQVALGISALLTSVPVSLGALHQAGSLSLFSFLLWALHELKRLK